MGVYSSPNLCTHDMTLARLFLFLGAEAVEQDVAVAVEGMVKSVQVWLHVAFSYAPRGTL